MATGAEPGYDTGATAPKRATVAIGIGRTTVLTPGQGVAGSSPIHSEGSTPALTPQGVAA